MTLNKLIERLLTVRDSGVLPDGKDTFVLSWDDTPEGLSSVDDVTLAEIQVRGKGNLSVVLLRVVREVDGRPPNKDMKGAAYSLVRDLPCPQGPCELSGMEGPRNQ